MGLRGQIWKRGGSRAKFGADRPSGGSEKVVVLIVVLLEAGFMVGPHHRSGIKLPEDSFWRVI